MSDSSRSVSDLFAGYLRRQIAAQAEGLGFAELGEEVVPHEAVPVQPVDPRVAWTDALAAVDWMEAGESSNGAGRSTCEVPPDWAKLVALQEPAVAVAFCLGNYPQMVRDLHPFLAGGERAIHRPTRTNPISVAASLLEWTKTQSTYPAALLAAAVLRLTRRFAEAGALLPKNSEVPSAWRSLHANEEAALAWHSGKEEEALRMWQALPASVPVLFNRGMASLFLGRCVEARTSLQEAVAQLPETSAWHHLGQLYLTLSEASS